MNNEHIKIIPTFTENFREIFNKVVAKGGEGLIIKHKKLAYGTNWAKLKKSYDVSCIVTGVIDGKGSFKDLIGSITLGVYHDGKIIEIGQTSGFDLATREDISKNWSDWEGKVVDVFAQEIQKGKRTDGNPVGRLRHPSFYRLREDIEPETITSEKLLDDLGKRVRSNRFKGKK